MSNAMYDRGFGTGHMLDMRPTQADINGEIHNVLQRVTQVTQLIGSTEPAPMTMCGLRLDDVGEPYQSGITTCDRCGILAAYKVLSVP